MTEDRFRIRLADETQEEVQERRRRLRTALDQVERALAVAAGASDEWQRNVTDALERLRTTWDDHIAKTEADDGFFSQILRDEPRLEAAVNRLQLEHDEMATRTEKLLARCQESALDAEEVEMLRTEVLDLLGQASRHRQHGSDLIYEAYQVDVSVGD